MRSTKSLHATAQELTVQVQEHTKQLREHTKHLAVDAENIRRLANIAATLEDLEGRQNPLN